MKTIEQVLEYVEQMNIITPEGVKVNVYIENIVSIKDIEKLSKQEKAHFFVPSEEIPRYWTSITLGKIDLIVKSLKQVKTK